MNIFDKIVNYYEETIAFNKWLWNEICSLCKESKKAKLTFIGIGLLMCLGFILMIVIGFKLYPIIVEFLNMYL